MEEDHTADRRKGKFATKLSCPLGAPRNMQRDRPWSVPSPGHQVLRAGFTQLAHGAVRTKGTYVSSLYRRLAARRGKRRAILAVAHSIMVSVFHMLTRHEPYRELGANYCDERRRHDTVDRLLSRIEPLGYRVHLAPVAAPAA